jgi:hypothetical protein
MNYELQITHEGQYILVWVAGDKNGCQVSLEIWGSVAKACAEHGCKKVLVLSNSAPLKTTEASNHWEVFNKVGITPDYRIAWVEGNARTKEAAKLIETVLDNRGYWQARMFEDPAEAKKWLLE